MEYSESIAKKAVELADTVKAAAILVLTETGESYELVAANEPKMSIIAATANDETFQTLLKKSVMSSLNIEFLDVEEAEKEKKAVEETSRTYAIRLLTRGASQMAQIEDAIVVAMHKGILKEEDVVVVVGSTLTSEANSLILYDIKKERLGFTLYDLIMATDIKQEVFEAVLNIALEIGREGRGGKLIGTAFLIGDSKKVLGRSRQLILNPFEGHIIGERVVTSPEIKETVKELAQLDGVFVVAEDGVIEAAGRYLDVNTSKVDIPRGLGTRHSAVAAMTIATDAVGVTVSQSGGVVRIFKDGEVVMAIEPQRRISLRTESLKQTFRKAR
jgi:DNA integrity scanning protein DisA with diadenylate cyclase activity